MSLKTLLLATTVCLGGALFSAGLSICAQAQTAPTLSGQVSSTEEGAMEGVLVSAKKEGSTIAKTVVSDDKGRFSFAAANLDPGTYVNVGASARPPTSSLPRPGTSRLSSRMPNG